MTEDYFSLNSLRDVASSPMLLASVRQFERQHCSLPRHRLLLFCCGSAAVAPATTNTTKDDR